MTRLKIEILILVILLAGIFLFYGLNFLINKQNIEKNNVTNEEIKNKNISDENIKIFTNETREQTIKILDSLRTEYSSNINNDIKKINKLKK